MLLDQRLYQGDGDPMTSIRGFPMSTFFRRCASTLGFGVGVLSLIAPSRLLAQNPLMPKSGGMAAVPAAPTYARDVAPILQQKCQQCHQSGKP